MSNLLAQASKEGALCITRGTTPKHTFVVPFNTSEIVKVLVVYSQNDIEVFHKKTEECTMSDNNVIVKLSQEDTLKLRHGQKVQIQLKVLKTDGDVYVSVIIVTTVLKCLSDEVL